MKSHEMPKQRQGKHNYFAFYGYHAMNFLALTKLGYELNQLMMIWVCGGVAYFFLTCSSFGGLYILTQNLLSKGRMLLSRLEVLGKFPANEQDFSFPFEFCSSLSRIGVIQLLFKGHSARF